MSVFNKPFVKVFVGLPYSYLTKDTVQIDPQDHCNRLCVTCSRNIAFRTDTNETISNHTNNI